MTPAKYFLALDGVKGDSLDASHKGWFEVTNVRGHVENGKVAHYQVTLKLGFTVEE